MKKWCSILALVVIACASLAAYVYQTEFYIYAAGQNGDHINARSYIRSGTYPTGPTWVQVRFPAYPSSSCREGFPYAGGCADSARSEGAGIWWSLAEVRGPYYPYGCWYAETQQYIEGFIQRNSGIQQCYGEPPPACDPALDGSYQPGACVSPIVIDATGKFKFKKVKHGPSFDIDADGVAEVVSWPLPNSPIEFLAFDRNNNGQIDSGAELFGNFTRPGSQNGFDALLKEAGGNLSQLDSSHPLFARLVLWNDRNANGVSEPEELRPASEALSAIGLGYFESTDQDKNGNAFKYVGWVRNLKGEQLPAYDVFLSTQE